MEFSFLFGASSKHYGANKMDHVLVDVEEVSPERFTLHTGFASPQCGLKSHSVMLQGQPLPGETYNWNWSIGDVVTVLSIEEWCFFHGYKLIKCFDSRDADPSEETKLL